MKQLAMPKNCDQTFCYFGFVAGYFQIITLEYNCEISSNKSKVMAFEGKYPRRFKIITDNKII
jgi:hypothetical protein